MISFIRWTVLAAPAIRGAAAIREYWSNDIAAAREAGITLVFAEDSAAHFC